MDYTDQQRAKIAAALEDYEPDDIAIVFYDQLVTLLRNDEEYFADGRGNSLAHTLGMAAELVKTASKAERRQP